MRFPKRAKTEGGNALHVEHKVLNKRSQVGKHGAHTKESFRTLKHSAFKKKIKGTSTRKMANTECGSIITKRPMVRCTRPRGHAGRHYATHPAV